MKLVKVYILLLLTTLSYSCGYNVSNPDDIIVGDYEVTSVTVTGCEDPAQNDLGSRLDFECYIEDDYQICKFITMTFSNDRDYVFSRNTRTIHQVIGTVLNDSDVLEGYYFIDQNQLRICFNGNCKEADFSFEGNRITLQIQQEGGCIETITANKL